jgi:hypothetical protein
MARHGRLPRAAGRPPRFLITGHRRAISLREAHLQAARKDRRHTLGHEPDGVLQSLLFHPASRGLRAQRATFRVLAEGRPGHRRGARFRGGLLAAAEVADAAPATALRPEGPSCARLRRCPDCPVPAASGGTDRVESWLLACERSSARSIAGVAASPGGACVCRGRRRALPTRLYEGGPFVKPVVRFLTPQLTHRRVSAAVSSV